MKYSDSHIDILTAPKTTANNFLLCSNVDIIVAAYYADNESKVLLNSAVKRFDYLKKKFGDKKFYFEIENLGSNDCLIEYGLSTTNNLVATLTWNKDNKLAGGAFEDADLTSLEKTVIKAVENSGIIDLSHLNEKSFYSVAKVTSKPLFVSHSAINYNGYSHKRNLSLEQVAEVVSSKGYFGFSFVNSFYEKDILLSAIDIARIIDKAVCAFGIDYFGIGSDFFGTKDLPIDLKNYADLDNLYVELSKLGYNTTDISKLLHDNLQRYFDNYFVYSYIK